MTGLPLCEPNPSKPCPERFRASASEWIDRDNFGELPDQMVPPAGIRLRWNWPLVRSVTGEPALPRSFSVRRYGPIDHRRLIKPQPTVGHMPRMFAPRVLWKPLVPAGDLDFVVGEAPCDAAQAIHGIMAPHAERVAVALIDVAGVTRLTGELGPGDSFYYELGDVHRLSFSARPDIVLIEGLSLTATDAQAADLGFSEIASLDAHAWLSKSLAKLSERMASDQLPPFVTIGDADWQEFQQQGRDLIAALDAGDPPPPLAFNYVRLALALRWEIAALTAWGFLDGDHVAAPAIDRIDTAAMLPPGATGVYAYQIVAEFEPGDEEVRSDIALTIVRPMPTLSGASVEAVAAPRTRSELVNHIDQVVTGTPRASDPADEQFHCRSSWEIAVRAPYVERVFTSPRATDSQIVADHYEDAGEFSSDGLRRPARFRGMERIELRDHDFRVPFYDSDIWLTLAVGDYWDRRVPLAPTPKIQPDIDYAGICIGIAGGTCDAMRGTATVSLDFVASPGWTADPLATHARAEIQLLIKDPKREKLEANVTLFPASPAAGDSWAAEIDTALATDELAPFVGGTLALDGFRATILGFAPVRRGRYRCEFEAFAVCAGVALYASGPAGVAARISEADGSDRVWNVAGTIPLLLDGAPAASTGEIALPELRSSTLLYCSTRLRFDFEGREIRGPLSSRAAIPYLHPAPQPPTLCYDIRTLAVDYYGRAIVRAEASDCERFDAQLAVTLAAATGIANDPSVFPATASKGLFGAQSPMGHRVVFDAFEILGNRPEDAVDTLGIRYVRTEDGRESNPELRPFGNRRTR